MAFSHHYPGIPVMRKSFSIFSLKFTAILHIIKGARRIPLKEAVENDIPEERIKCINIQWELKKTPTE